MKFKLFVAVIRQNKQILKQQQRLVDRYEQLSRNQENQERLNRITRYLAFIFILFRITVYFYGLLFVAS